MTTILAYILIGLFLATEGRARKGQQAQSLDRGQFDQGSTALIGVAFFVTSISLLLAPLFNYLGIGNIASAWAGWLGLVVAVLGIALRLWANRTLGESYTRTLRVTENQTIVQQGPYRVIRHPGYLGSILMWVGASLATTNWIAVIIALIVMIVAYYYRVQAEEKMLAATSSNEYSQYKSHTWKLIPFIF